MKIIIPTRAFPPAYCFGGPVTSMENLIPELAKIAEITVLTSEVNGENRKPNIEDTRWSAIGVKVNRIPRRNENGIRLTMAMRNKLHDIIYFNSLFDVIYTGSLLASRRARILENTPVVIAPRGQLDNGAFRIKKFKKQLYLELTKRLKFYEKCLWQATSEEEKERIERFFPEAKKGNKILIAENIPRQVNLENFKHWRTKKSGKARVVFLSRINRKKNLDLVLDVLKDVKGKVEFNIYGVRDDSEDYIKKCENKIGILPENIKVKEHGPVKPNEVPEIMASHDVFFFPTHGENFGHVIPESLGAGCPIILSDKTPWKDLDEYGAGWMVKNQNKNHYLKILEQVIGYKNQEMLEKKRNSVRYAKKIESRRDEFIQRNYRLFISAMELKK